MRWRWAASPFTVLAFLAPNSSPASARYDKSDAIHDCERAIVNGYGHRETYDESARDAGRDSYDVSGMVRIRDGHDKPFSCRVRHREVVNYQLKEESHGGDHHSVGGGAVAVVGAGVLGLALLGAMAGGNKADDHASKGNAYQSDPDADPLADRGYLEEECRRNLMDHLQQDVGSVAGLTLSNPYLDGRDLRGQGTVDFRARGSRKIDFICEFSRQGRIYDGSYHYY